MRRPKCFGCGNSSLCCIISTTSKCEHSSACAGLTKFRTFQQVFGDLSDKCVSVVQAIANLMIDYPHIPSETIGIPIGNMPWESIHCSGFSFVDGDMVINISGYTSEDSYSSLIGGISIPIEDVINDDQWHTKYISEATEDIECIIKETELEILKRLEEMLEPSHLPPTLNSLGPVKA